MQNLQSYEVSADSSEMAGWCWTGRATLSSVRQASSGAGLFLRRLGVSHDESSKWELLITEAGNNVALHSAAEEATKQFLEIHLLAGPNRVIGRVMDGGRGFEWPRSVSLPAGDAESGRGLYLIERLTDERDYQRGATGNTLTMVRRTAILPSAVKVGDDVSELEGTLDEMTEELASCYETLSALFRFSEESRTEDRVEALGTSLLRHLTSATSSDCAVLWLVSPASGKLEYAAGITLLDDAVEPVERRPGELEKAALRDEEDQWLEPGSVPLNAVAANPSSSSGLVHPLFDCGEPVGVLTIERSRQRVPMGAGEISVIHTLGQFFVQRVISVRHQASAMQARLTKRELELAADIQNSLLPEKMPTIPGLAIAGQCESALAVGGDYFDVLPGPDGSVLFVIADVMGKGLGASMIAAITRTAIRSTIANVARPAAILKQAGELLFDDLNRIEMFVTIAIGLVDPKRGVVEIANAGHCPVLFVDSDGAVAEAGPQSVPLGVERSLPISEFVVPVEPGSCLLAFTDGLIDPRCRQSFESVEELSGWFSSRGPGCHAGGIKAALEARFEDREPGEERADDQTFLVVSLDRTNDKLN